MSDLFGMPAVEHGLSDADLKRLKRRHSEVARGYAAPPGSGPDGETCKSCKHAYANHQAKTYFKCDLVKPSKGPRTDIRLRSPACSRWEAKDGQ